MASKIIIFTISCRNSETSNYGTFAGTVEIQGDDLVVNGSPIRSFAERDPANIPWDEMGVDIVVESTGRANQNG